MHIQRDGRSTIFMIFTNLPGKIGIFHSNLRSIFQCHEMPPKSMAAFLKDFPFHGGFCIFTASLPREKWCLLGTLRSGDFFFRGELLMVQKLPRSTCLDGGKTLVNSRLVCFQTVRVAKFYPCFKPHPFVTKKLRCAWVQWRVWRCRSWCNGPRRNGRCEGPVDREKSCCFLRVLMEVFWKAWLGGCFKYFFFSPRNLEKWSNLTSIFSKWVETTS